MKAILFKTGRQRFYELSEPITKGKSDLDGEIDLVEECAKAAKHRFKPEYIDEALEYLKDGVRIVIVSDGITHIERLAFPGVKFKHGDCVMLSNDIAGKHTFMSEGGDPNAVYDDEVYLRFLCRLNGIPFDGVESKLQEP